MKAKKIKSAKPDGSLPEEPAIEIKPKAWEKKIVVVNFKQTLMAGDKKLLNEGGPVTLEAAAIESLNSVRPPPGVTKDEVGSLQMRILKSKKLEVSGREISWIKSAIDAVLMPLVVKAAFDLLDPKREFV